MRDNWKFLYTKAAKMRKKWENYVRKWRKVGIADILAINVRRHVGTVKIGKIFIHLITQIWLS